MPNPGKGFYSQLAKQRLEDFCCSLMPIKLVDDLANYFLIVQLFEIKKKISKISKSEIFRAQCLYFTHLLLNKSLNCLLSGKESKNAENDCYKCYERWLENNKIRFEAWKEICDHLLPSLFNQWLVFYCQIQVIEVLKEVIKVLLPFNSSNILR